MAITIKYKAQHLVYSEYSVSVSYLIISHFLLYSVPYPLQIPKNSKKKRRLVQNYFSPI